LRLRKLILRNFRNYDNLELTFHSNLILFVGPNAAGKTNILESIFMACTGRSHRTPRDKELIKLGKKETLIRTKAEKQLGTSEIAIYLSMGEKKKILINESPASRMGELMGHLNSVMFSPDDMKLIKEGPVERRRFMDMELSQVKPKYFYYLQQYNKILNHRNNLLKNIYSKPSLVRTLPVWNNQLAEAGSYIIWQRKLFIDSLQSVSREIHRRMTDGREELTLIYKSSVPFKTGSMDEIRSRFLKVLEERHEDDIDRGFTGMGCHRDDILFQINGADVKVFGSQGQKRTTVLTLKLSELEYMYRQTGEYPLLLLDDALSELDLKRQQMLLEYIGKVQTFITLTDLNQIPDIRKKNPQIFRIQSGNAQLMESISF